MSEPCVCPTGMVGHWATCPAAPSEPPAEHVPECGVQNPDHPREYRCEYPAGHPPIVDPDFADEFWNRTLAGSYDHGAPSKGAWWNTPEPEPPAEACPICGHVGYHVDCDEPPAEAQQDDDDEVATVGQAILHELLHTTRQPNSGALALDLARAALAARPSADTETLRRVRELADELDADAERAYQRSCGAYRDEGSDGQHRAYEDAAERIRAALDGKR